MKRLKESPNGTKFQNREHRPLTYISNAFVAMRRCPKLSSLTPFGYGLNYLSFFLFFSLNLIAQDYKLWYNKPAEKWTDALPIGNGRIGAMIFGGIEKDRIQFNEETLWTGYPRSYNRPDAYKYLPEIRKLLAEGKQKEAEKLAEEQFMGLKSKEGDRQKWLDVVLQEKRWADPTIDHSAWPTMKVPAFDGWETVGFEDLDGAVWLRTTVEIPENWQGKKLVLDLNRIRDADLTYFNGKLVGQTTGTEGRKYTVPADLVKVGRNVIAIQVLNFSNKGGITGYKEPERKIGVYPENQPEAIISLYKDWHYKIQDTNTPPVGAYQAEYQAFGDINLHFSKFQNVSNYKRELTLDDAISRTTFTADDVNFKREYLVSEPQQVLAINLSADKPKQINFEAELWSPHRSFKVQKIDNQNISLTLEVKHGALRGHSILQVQIKNGSVEVENDRVVVKNADQATVYMSAATNYVDYQDVSANPSALCTSTMTGLKGKTYEQIKAAHIKEYQSYYNKFSINLGQSDSQPTDERLAAFGSSPDPSFMALYVQYGRYLLIASSRPKTRPANLQGIWNDLNIPPWGGKYTTNINAEMNYWGAEFLNLSPMHDALFGMIKDLSKTGQETAKNYYNARGWVLHHNTDLWRGTAPINASNHGIWVTGGAWLCQHLWERYAFTQDEAFLRSAYPIMKSASQFFVDFLVKDPKTGWLISTPGNSPENGGLVAGPTMDHQIIRDLFKNTIAASKVLKIDALFADTLLQKYQQIAPNQIGKFGQLQEWLEDKDEPKNKHRHVSHLWGLYPGKEINYDETPQMVEAAKQSLIFRGDEGTGWSLAWKINFWSRFKDGEHAQNMVKMLLRPILGSNSGSYLNLFDAHPPFQIDGNFGGSAGIAEMLLQSHTKFIDILPALPQTMPHGNIKGIRARGGFELDFSWKESKLISLKIKSLGNQKCTLRYGGKVYAFQAKKGADYVVDLGKFEK